LSRVKLMEVKLALLKSGFNLAEIVVKGSSSCLVTARDAKGPKGGRLLWRAYVLRAARRLIAERVGVDESEVELNAVSLPPEIEQLYESGHRLQFVKPRSIPGPGMVRLDLMVLDDAAFVKRLPVTFSYSLNVRCVVATRVLKKGDVIVRSDVALKSLSLPDARKGYYKAVEEVVGMEVSKTLIRGEVVKPSKLKTAMLVNRGDVVRVVFRRPYVVVESSARAVGSAAKGEIVSLEDPADRRKKYTGVVVGPRLVEVK